MEMHCSLAVSYVNVICFVGGVEVFSLCWSRGEVRMFKEGDVLVVKWRQCHHCHVPGL